MKALAKFLTVVTVLVLLAGGYVIWASELGVSPAGTLVESAADRTDAFESIRQTAAVGGSGVTLYADGMLGEPDEYVFVTYTLRLRNSNVLNAEWLQLELTPQEGDVLLLASSVEDVPAFSEQLYTVVLLTSRNTASYARSAELTYYVYGHEHKAALQLAS